MPAKTMDCPICGTAMQKQVVSDGIEVDFCDWHGVWLDAGELEQLMAKRNAGQGGRAAGVGKAIAQGMAGAAVVGAGFHLGGRVVGGLLDGLFGRRG